MATAEDDLDLTSEQRKELRRRLADHRLNPRPYKTWEQLREELEALRHASGRPTHPPE